MGWKGPAYRSKAGTGVGADGSLQGVGEDKEDLRVNGLARRDVALGGRAAVRMVGVSQEMQIMQESLEGTGL